MTPPKPLLHDDLTPTQRKALAAAVTANDRLTAHQAKEAKLIEARDKAVRTAVEAGITQTLLGKTLGLTNGMVWKIKEGLSTKQLEERQRVPKKR